MSADNEVQTKKPTLESYMKYKNKVKQALYKIGWKKSFISNMTDPITKEQWKHFDQEYTIEHTIKSIITPCEKYMDTLYDFLIECGFRKRRAKFWGDLISFESYSYDQELDFIIEYAMNPYKPISDHRYLYNHENENVWYTHDIRSGV